MRITLVCATLGCSQRINASPNRNKRHCQVKTYNYEHTCERNKDNHKANSSRIVVTFIYLVKANNQVAIDA